MDSQGNVVTAPIRNAITPNITIPSNALSITVDSDGTVSVTLPNQTQAQQVGSIQLATFANPGGLNSGPRLASAYQRFRRRHSGRSLEAPTVWARFSKVRFRRSTSASSMSS